MTKGTAGKSASGASMSQYKSMSQYNMEVESRLQALEARPATPLAVGGAALDKLAEFERRVNNWQESLDIKFDIADAKLKEWDGFDGDAFGRLDNIERKVNIMVAAFKQGPGYNYVPKSERHLLDF